MNKLTWHLRQLKKRLKRQFTLAMGFDTPWYGDVTVIVTYADGSREIHRMQNIITNAGKNMYRDILRGAQTDGAIRWIALGSGSTAELVTQTQLVSEQFRKAVTQFNTVGLSNGQVNTILYVAPGEANTFTIAEVGWFASPSATSATNSGIMIARVLLGTPISKTALQSIQITRTDSIG